MNNVFLRDFDVSRYLVRKSDSQDYVPYQLAVGLIPYTNADGRLFYRLVSPGKFLDCSRATRVKFTNQRKLPKRVYRIKWRPHRA